MKRTLPIIFETLERLALGLWLGGLVTAGLLLQLGGTGVGPATLERLNPLFITCGIALAGILFVRRHRYERIRPYFIGDGVRQLLVFAALLMAASAGFSTSPGLRMLVALGACEVVILLTIVGLTAWLQQPYMGTIAPAPGTTPASAARKFARAPARRRPPK